jgi:hypothetical protein
MANSDKNIRITGNKNTATGIFPQIVFTGASAGASVVTLQVLDDNTISFSSNEGQVFSIDSNNSVGTIWSVNDISGIPQLRSSAGTTVGIAEFAGGLGVGITNPSTGTYKFTVRGQSAFASTNSGVNEFVLDTSAATGSNSLNILGQNSLRLYNSGSSFYTALKAGTNAGNYTLTFPAAAPTAGAGYSMFMTDNSGTITYGGFIQGTGTSLLVSGTGVTIRNKRPLLLTFASGFTPATGTTADSVVLRLPESFTDGTTSVTWVPKKAFIRTETFSAGSTLINLQYSAGIGTFTSTNLIGGAGLSVGGAGIAESSSTNFTASTLTSGTKLRVNFSSINASHSSFLIYLQLEEL